MAQQSQPDATEGPDTLSGGDVTSSNHSSQVPVDIVLPNLLLNLSEAAQLGLVVSDPSGRIRKCNTHFAAMLARSISEIEGHSFLDFTASEDRDAESQAFLAFLASGRERGHLLKRYTLPDGTFAWAEVSTAVVRNAVGVPLFLVSLTRDVTDSRRIENSLRSSELAYLQLFRETTDGLAVFDVIRDAFGRPCDLRCVDVNPAFERVTGRSAVLCLGRCICEVWSGFSEIWKNRLLEALHAGPPAPFEDQLSIANRYFDIRMFSLNENRWAMFITDVTGRKEEENRHRQMVERAHEIQRLESLGRLAGGIAHDFNNLLMRVLGSADLVRAELPSNHGGREHLDAIIEAARRGSELCRQLLDYAGRGHLTITEFSLNDLIEDMAHLLAILLPRQVRLQCELEPSLPKVRGDPSRIMQAIVNLVTNAAEAIGDGPGFIRIATATENLDQTTDAGPGSSEPLPPGRYVAFEVSDSGPGMSADILARIFDPFFSTHTEGRGLGLPAVLGIMRSHRGGIRVMSQPGAGSTFRLLLPAVAPPADLRAASAPTLSELWVIESDDRLRNSIIRILESTGHPIRPFAKLDTLPDTRHSPNANIGCVVIGSTQNLDAERLHKLSRLGPVILIGAAAQIASSETAIPHLPRSFTRAELIHVVQKVLAQHRAASSSSSGTTAHT